jgi:hypothetical protein
MTASSAGTMHIGLYGYTAGRYTLTAGSAAAGN